MAAPSKIRSGSGVRDFQIFVLDASGYPAATSTTVYGGIDVSGVSDVTINDPLPQLISHRGDDRIFALDSLPPTTPLEGQIKVSKINDTVDSALTGNLSTTVGEINLIGINTDLKGSENQVGVALYRQALDTDPASGNFGLRVWDIKIAPVAQIIPVEQGMGANTTDMLYTFRPQFVSKHIWGAPFAAGTEGYVQAQMIRGVSQYKPRIVAFKGDGSTTTFSLGNFGPAVSTSKVAVYDNGVVAAPTVATTSLVFTTAPTSGHIVVTVFEVANTTGDNI